MQRFFLLFICSFFLVVYLANAQQPARNLVIVTFDGMRWQEIFSGVDSVLLHDAAYTRDPDEMQRLYWDASPQVRREKLFPFIWGVIAHDGQLFGNRILGNDMNVANVYHFSYPGYNEIFTGYADFWVNSNNKIPNPNRNVLGFLNNKPLYHNHVAAFTSWSVFPYILNKWESGIYVNADEDSLPDATPELQLLNLLQRLTAKPLDLRPDIFTYAAAKEYLKAYHPRVLYIAFDETDDYAHAGMYDQYIKSAHAEDGMIRDLWAYLQQDPFYAGQTVLLLTCDHGRGTGDAWRNHGTFTKGSSAIWMAVMGPGIAPTGEHAEPARYHQKQIAATIAQILGFTFQTDHRVAKSLYPILTENNIYNEYSFKSQRGH
ncbi:phosphoglyceromutase [Thermoflavifilum aggregans]|nr:phosphoglyceromutase [Thermoflavifilum aggregans]